MSVGLDLVVNLTLLCLSRGSKRPPPAVFKNNLLFGADTVKIFCLSVSTFYTSRAFSNILYTTLLLISQVFQILGHIG